MTIAVMLLLLTIGSALQMLLPGLACLGQVKAPFLMAVVVYYALTRNSDVMLAAAFFGGVLHDSLSPIPLGYSVFCFAVLGFVIGRFRNLVMNDSPVTQVFFGGSAAGAFSLLMYFLLNREGLIALPPGAVVLKIIGSAIGGTVATVVIFRLAGFLDRLVGNVERNDDIGEVEWSV